MLRCQAEISSSFSVSVAFNFGIEAQKKTELSLKK